MASTTATPVQPRRFQTAGEHFTPREVIRFMVNLLFIEDEARLREYRQALARST